MAASKFFRIKGDFMDSKQVVLITGSSTGFGRMIAETLARDGHTVFATMRDPEGRNATNASEIRILAARESLPLHVLELDVTNDVSVEQAVQTAVKQSGRVDVAINNAGYGLIGLAEAVTTEQAQQIMNTNFFGSVRVNRAVLPYMRGQRSGLLLHISSGAGRLVIPTFGFYCASKFALESLAEAYHYELGPQGIESCIVQPGAYQTPVFGNIVVAADQVRTDTYGVANQVPAKINSILTTTAGNPQEVADAVLRIVETPAGQRKLRYRISAANLGVDEINALCEQMQTRLFEAFGISGDTAFAPRSTAATS
jgi:NAD(P)-dependent dehydrogenase (short-subunit alcohol dehydrogenase family)